MSLSQNLEALQETGPEGIGRFKASLDPQWIEQALQATGTASIRRRKLAADQAVWLVLGMGLFADRSICDLVDHLDLVIPGVESLAPSAIPQARYRLGAEPIKWLFEKVAATWADNWPEAKKWNGLSLHAVDGTCLRVWDSDDNFEHFGKPGGRGGANDAGYPQLRMTCLMNLDTRLLRAASFGPYAYSEHRLAASLWDHLPDDSLTILDRGFVDYKLFAALRTSGTARHLLVRMRKNMTCEPIEVLPDGSQRAYLKPSRTLRRNHPEIVESIEVRIIEYQHKGGSKNRLFTTLLDSKRYPANDLIELYHDRWEIEIAYDELKTHMLERKECLRSKKPTGVAQELWGMLLVYNLVRREMLLAADAHDVAPRRISFRSSLLWIRTFLLMAAQTQAPANLPNHLGEFRSTLDVLVLPKRRKERRYPRHVKIKMSNYLRNRGNRDP